MSEHRRRSPNPGGEQQPPGRGADGQRPYAYGAPPEGAPSYGRPRPDEVRSEGAARRPRPAGGRETAQQPRLSRAEMRRQSQKGGRRGGPPGGPGGPGGQGGRGGNPPKKRFIDYPRYGKSGFRRWLPSWKLILSLFLIFFGSGVAAVGFAYASTGIPDDNKALQQQNNIYYWADGTEMTRNTAQNRQAVELGDISKAAQDATIAAENETFRTDKGIDPKGIARAIYKMATGGDTQGGSTITQQYVKNTYLSQDQTVSRKLKEFFITLKINGKLTKDQILAGYLNTSWYGRGATGIQAASQAYYGKDAKSLTPCEGAMLAGLLKGAALYDPTIDANKQRMQERWEYVLNRMVVNHLITETQRTDCGKTFPTPIPRKAPANMNGEISYLVDTANKYLTATDPAIDDQELQRGGYKIYTTFDKGRVQALKDAVDQVQGASLHPDKREADKFVQVGASSIDPKTGAIVALYGGPGVENNHFTNNADAPGIPVGSTFKPFVLATAMQVGVLTKTGPDGKPTRISTDSRYLSDNLSQIYKPDGSPVIGDDGKPYHQANDENNKTGYVDLKEAMRNSYNVPFVQLGQDVGGKNVEDMAIRLGIRKASLAPSNTVTFPLGTSTPSAIRMAAAYSVFANHGQQNDPFSVKRLQKNGADLPKFDRKVANTRVLDPDVADSITDVLQNVAAHGTGTKTNALGFPVAGKTGTTDSGTSAWWVGYTNSLTTSVGMWREEPGKPGLLSLKGTAGQTTIHGGDFPTAIFTAYMKTVGPGSPRAFTKPSDDPGVQVDSSGAPSTASPSPSASPSDSTSAAPTTTAAPTTGAPTDSPSPTGKPSRSCFLFCPSPTGDASPTGGGTSTKTPGGGGGGGGGGGAATGG